MALSYSDGCAWIPLLSIKRLAEPNVDNKNDQKCEKVQNSAKKSKKVRIRQNFEYRMWNLGEKADIGVIREWVSGYLGIGSWITPLGVLGGPHSQQ